MLGWSILPAWTSVLAVLKIIRGLRMTVMDLMLHSISQRPSMTTWREGFFRSKALVQFLNVLGTDERATSGNFVSVYDPLLFEWLLTRLTPRWRPFFTCHQKIHHKKPLHCYVAFFCQLCRRCRAVKERTELMVKT
ncbi:hypothetical protein F4604DRAFT_1723549 [Suillus subluteus]|nr:hypothetical protein F4604DRAFT_1723549 [Suillus subluteus]